MEPDYFDRQKRIKNWDQSLYSSMKVTCLGVGGLGSVVSMNLCRLGVKHLILIDYDVVEGHNLNRQLLFTKSDIGSSKSEAAKRNLDSFHNLCTTIEAYNLDIIKQWDQVVSIISDSSAVFNMIDYGDSFDLAAQSLCLKLKIPFIQGGTFSQMVNVEFFPPNGKSCLACGVDGMNELCEKIKPSQILQIENLEFLNKNVNPVGLSNTYLCGMCGMMMVAKLGEYLLGTEGIEISNRSILYVNTMESVNFMIEPKPDCVFCLNSLHDSK